MTLVASPRHRVDDLACWEVHEQVDRINARSDRLQQLVERSIAEVRAFAEQGRCYASVSWGKDSMLLAHLIATEAPHVPLVHLHSWWGNPDSDLVRDLFLQTFPQVRYDEIEVTYDWEREINPAVSLYLREGYALAANRHGDRYLTGMRKQESKSRAMRMMRYGMSTEMTCAPIGWWNTASVFAYLHKHELPVHPVYACLQGGLLERDQLRVDMLSEERGSGMGRREWEQLYYRQELAVIASRTRARR